MAYILPMAIFLAFTWVGGTWPQLYPLSYVAKTVVVTIALIVLWPHFTRIRWTHAWLGVGVGIIGIVQWVGMEKLLLAGGEWTAWTRMSAEPFVPTEHFASQAWMWSFLMMRLAGAVLLVPVMEELFWRDFAWRTIIAPNDFKLAEVGEFDWKAVLIVPGIFAMVHIQWLTAVVWALLIAWLLVRTKSLGACIIAHAVTNLLLGLYVLYMSFVVGQPEWYFW
jgi:uncharacterized protein